MVAPYPEINKKLNENFETLKTGKDLKFSPNQGTRLIKAKEADKLIRYLVAIQSTFIYKKTLCPLY